MDYTDLAVRCPRKAVKLNHSPICNIIHAVSEWYVITGIHLHSYVMGYDAMWYVIWCMMWCGVMYDVIQWCDVVGWDGRDGMRYYVIGCDVILCDRMWCDSDVIGYDLIMMWYERIVSDVIEYDMMWCGVIVWDVICCDLIWSNRMWYMWYVMWHDVIRCGEVW